MSNPFHLALPAGDIDSTLKFYTEILGCKIGNKEKGKWVDIDFWGNELTLHQTKMKLSKRKTRRRYGKCSNSPFWSALRQRHF